MLESEYGKAVLLGIVEGLTEFIPVSSTGHLILFGDLLQFREGEAATFEIFIQLGAILAVVVLYTERFTGLLDFSKEDRSGFRGWNGLGKLFLACLPAFVFGALLHDTIEHFLFIPIPVAFALILGGLVFIVLERSPREPSVFSLGEISGRQAFVIGLFQCLALWPGISRSGATIIGGLLVGLERKIAAEFSFLVAVPVMFAAVSYSLLKSSETLNADFWGVLLVGFVVSFLVALLAIRFFIGMLSRFTLAPFGWYRIVVGALVLILLW